MKTTTSIINNSINDSLLRCALVLMPFVLMCVALLPGAQAVRPAPDGGYPGGNTAEGQTRSLPYHRTSQYRLGFSIARKHSPATSTPQKDFARFSATPGASKILPPALTPLKTTPPATRTRPVERSPFLVTRKARPTQLTVFKPSSTTPPALQTRPTEHLPSLPTPRAPATMPSALARSLRT